MKPRRSHSAAERTGLPDHERGRRKPPDGFEAAGEAYKTFHLRGTKDPKYRGTSEFCKTENRPYDEAVTAILTAPTVHATGSTTGAVRSEGRWDKWLAGVELFE